LNSYLNVFGFNGFSSGVSGTNQGGAPLAILMPMFSRTFATSFAAASLTLSHPDFLHNVWAGAKAITNFSIWTSLQPLFVFGARLIFVIFLI